MESNLYLTIKLGVTHLDVARSLIHSLTHSLDRFIQWRSRLIALNIACVHSRIYRFFRSSFTASVFFTGPSTGFGPPPMSLERSVKRHSMDTPRRETRRNDEAFQQHVIIWMRNSSYATTGHRKLEHYLNRATHGKEFRHTSYNKHIERRFAEDNQISSYI